MSDSATSGGRKFEMSIEVAAPADRVWKAITEAEHLARWFAPEARVKPGVGGAVWLSWGGPFTVDAPITIWEPGRRLRTANQREKPWFGGEEKGGAPADAREIAVDYFVEPRAGGACVLRLVHSGFGPGKGWDDEFDSISRGWKFELRSLRHYLARHFGQERRAVFMFRSSPLPAERAWGVLVGPTGLIRDARLDDLKEGDRYRIQTETGDVLEGRVLVSVPGRSFAGTVESLDDALLRLEAERDGSGSMPTVWLSVWGPKRSRVDELKQKWSGVMERLFPATAPT